MQFQVHKISLSGPMPLDPLYTSEWEFKGGNKKQNLMFWPISCESKPIHPLHSIKSILCYEDDGPVSYECDGPLIQNIII